MIWLQGYFCNVLLFLYLSFYASCFTQIEQYQVQTYKMAEAETDWDFWVNSLHSHTAMCDCLRGFIQFMVYSDLSTFLFHCQAPTERVLGGMTLTPTGKKEANK